MGCSCFRIAFMLSSSFPMSFLISTRRSFIDTSMGPMSLFRSSLASLTYASILSMSFFMFASSLFKSLLRFENAYTTMLIMPAPTTPIMVRYAQFGSKRSLDVLPNSVMLVLSFTADSL